MARDAGDRERNRWREREGEEKGGRGGRRKRMVFPGQSHSW